MTDRLTCDLGVVDIESSEYANKMIVHMNLILPRQASCLSSTESIQDNKANFNHCLYIYF